MNRSPRILAALLLVPLACLTELDQDSGPRPGDSSIWRDSADTADSHAPADTGDPDSGGMDTGAADTQSPVDTGDTGPAPPSDLRAAGPHAVALSTGSLAVSGCTLDYDRYAPQGGTEGPLVVLAHGLECSRDQMAGVAQHWASWGLDVVAPDLCHSTAFDLDQQQNGEHMVELAQGLGSSSTLYAGHSAGGLASLVAAAEDSAALGQLGLDPTEWMGIGAVAAASVDLPAYALLAEWSTCNGYNNALPLYAGISQGRVLKLSHADHCDLQSPNDCAACSLLCGVSQSDVFSDDEILTHSLGLSTAFLLWRAGLDSSASPWWEPGGIFYEELLAAGAIAEF